jgi:malate synthase
MSGHEETSLAFQAARALVLEGAAQPNGYTEPLLHAFRRKLKGE